MESDSEEEIMEEYVEQAIRDDIVVNNIVLSIANTSLFYHKNFLKKKPCRDSPQTGWIFTKQILDGNKVRCHQMFRMEKHVFYKLCNRLQSYGLTSTVGIKLEEAVGMFLMTLAHGVGNRMIQEVFQHSGETVSRQFNHVLGKMVMLAFDEIRPLENYNEVPQYIRKNPKYWPYFKDCIGAIDGTHVRVSLPTEEQIPYIGRKGIPTQNIMAVCDFDMLFTFVWPGWEGSAHDTRIFLEALRSNDLKFPKPPHGKYYLVDSGYPNMKGYLAPYKGDRYHLPQFRSGGQPRGARETFNYVHSSLRSVIERTFGVWKSRWGILARMPNYKIDKQVTIVTASMALHNFIRREAISDLEFEAFEEEDNYSPDDEITNTNVISDESEMGVIRDEISRNLML